MSANPSSLQPTVEDYSSDCNSSEESSSQDTVESTQPKPPPAQALPAKVNAASDSGYSSRTAATGDSLDSAQSSDKTAVPSPAAAQPSASPNNKKKKKKKRQNGEGAEGDRGEAASNEPNLEQNSPITKQTSPRPHSRKDKHLQGPLPICPDCERGKCKQSSSRPAPRGPFSAPFSYPYHATTFYSVPSPMPILHPGIRPPVSTNLGQPRPPPTVIQNVQPRTSSLAYTRPQAPLQDVRTRPRSYYHADSARTPSLAIPSPESRWPPNPEAPHSAHAASPTYFPPLSASPTREPRYRWPSIRDGRSSHPHRSTRPVSLYAPEINFDQDLKNFTSPEDMRSHPTLPPRRDSYGSSYPTSMDDIYVDGGRHHYEVLSDDEYDDVDQYDDPHPPPQRHQRQYRQSRHAADYPPSRPARSRTISSYSGSRSPLALEQYDHFNERPHHNSDLRSMVGTSHRSDPTEARFRRPSYTNALSSPHISAPYRPRYPNPEFDADHQKAAAYHRAEVEAERYQAERSGYPRFSNVRQLEDVKRMGREQLRNETRSQADSSHDGSNASDALKLTINNQTLTITQGEGGNPEILIENNRRQTRYPREGSMQSSGATSRSSRRRTLQGNSSDQIASVSDGGTRARRISSRKPSSASRHKNDGYNNENM